MGYMIQQALANCLREKRVAHNITTVISQVIVWKGSRSDPVSSVNHPI